MDLGLHGKEIVVTGAAGGIGAAICVALKREGAYPIGLDVKPFGDSELSIIVTDYMRAEARGDMDFRNLKAVLNVDNVICQSWNPHSRPDGGEYFPTTMKFFQVDVADRKGLERVLSKHENLYGLVNNAGLLGGDAKHGGRTDEAFDKMFDAHVRTAYTATEVCAPKIKKSGKGAIVNIGSIDVWQQGPDLILYAMAKGALYAGTRAWANTYAPEIRVNMVSPGHVNTENDLKQYVEEPGKSVLAHFRGKTPLRRSSEPSEIADAVLYLLSEKSGNITGANLIADCGFSISLFDPLWVKDVGDLKSVYVEKKK